MPPCFPAAHSFTQFVQRDRHRHLRQGPSRDDDGFMGMRDLLLRGVPGDVTLPEQGEPPRPSNHWSTFFTE
jgi:hypothetical protein